MLLFGMSLGFVVGVPKKLTDWITANDTVDPTMMSKKNMDMNFLLENLIFIFSPYSNLSLVY